MTEKARQTAVPFAWNVLRRLVREIEKEHDRRRAPRSSFFCLSRQIPQPRPTGLGGVGDAVPRGLGSAQTRRRANSFRPSPILRPKKGTTHVVPFLALGRVWGFEPPGLLDPNQARYQTSPHPGKAFLPLYSSPPRNVKHRRRGKFQGIFPQRPHRDGIERHRKGASPWLPTGQGSTPGKAPSDPRGETASAATGGLPGSLRRGVSGPGHRLWPLAQLSSTVGELVRADTDFQAVFAQMGGVFLQGRASGGDLPLPLGRGLPHRRDRRGIRANRTPGPRGGSRPNRANGRRGGPRGGSFIAQADSG